MSDEVDEVEEPDESSRKGLQPPRTLPEDPKQATARDLAHRLFKGAGVIVLLLVIAATWSVLVKGSDDSTALLAFFGSIVSALGTLLGGIVGYYYGQGGDKP